MALFDEEIEVSKITSPTVDDSGTPDDIADIDDLGKEPDVVEEPATKAIKAPSRYAGKTQEELAQMLEDAQTQIGRQSSEIGEVRKLADDLVKNSLKVAPKVAAPPVEEHEDDFFTDPEAAVARAVSKHPAVAAAKEAAELAVRERSAAKVRESHPDMEQVIGSTEFAAWVKASPMRVRMYALADQYDAEAADELLANFKASNSFAKTEAGALGAGAAKAAATLAAGSVGTNATSASTPAVKKYRRSDIMRLMTTDPTRYEAMADDILKAYAEGRVV
jgi:hypothetical protein